MSKHPKSKNLGKILPKNTLWDEVAFACIGSDRSTGDSLGPLVGSELKSLGYEVYGTLEEPLHAMNMVERLKDLPKDKILIAIDASLGNSNSIGQVRVDKGPMKPGAGVGKDLPPVGDYNIVGIVNVSGFMEYFVLQNTRLSLVYQLKNEIVDIIKSTLPIINTLGDSMPRPNLSAQVHRWINKAIKGEVV